MKFSRKKKKKYLQINLLYFLNEAKHTQNTQFLEPYKAKRNKSLK